MGSRPGWGRNQGDPSGGEARGPGGAQDTACRDELPGCDEIPRAGRFSSRSVLGTVNSPVRTARPEPSVIEWGFRPKGTGRSPARPPPDLPTSSVRPSDRSRAPDTTRGRQRVAPGPGAGRGSSGHSPRPAPSVSPRASRIITTLMTRSRPRHSPRAGQRPGQCTSSEAEGAEPAGRTAHGAGGEEPPQRAVLVGQGADEDHRVEVDVRVEPGHRERREDHRAQPGTGPAAGPERLAVTAQPGAETDEREPAQIGRPGPGQRGEHPCRARHDEPDAQRAGTHEDDVGGDADADHPAQVRPTQPLPQHPRVLGADGDDEAESRGEAREVGVHPIDPSRHRDEHRPLTRRDCRPRPGRGSGPAPKDRPRWVVRRLRSTLAGAGSVPRLGQTRAS